MALKATIETLDGVPEVLAKEYEEVEQDGKTIYRLSVEGGEDVGALKRAKDYEKAARQKAETAAKEREAALMKMQEEIDGIRAGAIPKGDFEALKKSLEERHGKAVADLTTRLQSREAFVHQLLVGDAAVRIANKMAATPDDAEILATFIAQRLAVDEDDGTPVTRVRGPDGKPSVMTPDELEKEFRTTPRFAKLIAGSKASGGGASGANGGAPPGGKDWSKVTDATKLSAPEKAQWAKWRSEQRRS